MLHLLRPRNPLRLCNPLLLMVSPLLRQRRSLLLRPHLNLHPSPPRRQHALRPPLRRVQLKYPHRFRPRLPHRFRRKPLRPYLHKFLRHLPPRRKRLPLHPPIPHSL